MLQGGAVRTLGRARFCSKHQDKLHDGSTDLFTIAPTLKKRRIQRMYRTVVSPFAFLAAAWLSAMAVPGLAWPNDASRSYTVENGSGSIAHASPVEVSGGARRPTFKEAQESVHCPQQPPDREY
jgi:hypothetical protein